MAGAFDAANDATMALGPLAGLAREDFIGAIGLMLRQTAANPTKRSRRPRVSREDVVKIMTGKSDLAPDAKDKRFMDPAWTLQSVFQGRRAILSGGAKGRQKLYRRPRNGRAWNATAPISFSQMIIDALAPTNSLIGNPTAQKRLVDSGGLSLGQRPEKRL